MDVRGEGISTKAGLLLLLEGNSEMYISGEQAAEKLGVSRAAVWKAAESLRKQGLALESVPGLGYRLHSSNDLLTNESVRVFMNDLTAPVRVFQEVDSTNLEAKRWALEGAPHGAMVVSTSQTAGRGRMGRAFKSPTGGLYLSIVLRPALAENQKAVLVTAAAAVTTCRAVSSLCNVELGIKWVNDLFYQEKKCCGILTEAGTDIETGCINYMVVGIGINYATPAEEFTDDLREIAVSLFPKARPPVPRAQLAASIYKLLMEEFEILEQRSFLEEYRRRSIVLGKQITVMAAPPYRATAVSINEDAQLVVKGNEGEEKTISYGEISVKVQ